MSLVGKTRATSLTGSRNLKTFIKSHQDKTFDLKQIRLHLNRSHGSASDALKIESAMPQEIRYCFPFLIDR